MSNLVVVSAVRDGELQLDEYRRRVAELEWKGNKRVCVCEGDSLDHTWAELVKWAAESSGAVKVVKLDLGMPRYGSVVNRDRFIVLARVFNRALDLVDWEWADWVLFVPFEIEYHKGLAMRLAKHNVDMISPLTWAGSLFYDTWAMTERGMPTLAWGNFTWDYAQTYLGKNLIEMDRIGGTVLMKADVLRAGCRYTEEEVDRGLSRCARQKGYRLWVDPTTHVYHPPLRAERVYET